MDEMLPRTRGEGVAEWDGTERRARPGRRVRRVGVPAWRNPGRMSGAVLVSLVASSLWTGAQFLVEHVEVHWR